ncbi:MULTISPECIES: L-rhamnose mutarotase [unclassified Kribbella]|uniref:L-rhamnose mutarotase n=1 Tax=unclassified Kribbella TaxID=2644121 RepID=UPI0033E83848
MSRFRPVVLVSVLREGQEDAYEAAHQRIPADLHASLTGAGVRDWAIWRDGRTLLHLVDVDDFALLEQRLAGDPVNDRWQAEMAVFVERFEEVAAIPVLSAPALVWSMRLQEASDTGRARAAEQGGAGVGEERGDDRAPRP